MHISFNKIKWYIKDNDGSKYLTLILVDGKKCETKKYEKTWNKIKHLSLLENNDLAKMMVNTWNSDFIHNNLPLKQELEMHNVVSDNY